MLYPDFFPTRSTNLMKQMTRGMDMRNKVHIPIYIIVKAIMAQVSRIRSE